MTWKPPIQFGIHLAGDDQLKIAVSMRNMTDESVHLSTSSSGLFHIKVKERTFTKDGTELVWSPDTMNLQVPRSWELKTGATVTRHYDIPNEGIAREKAHNWSDEFNHWNEDNIDEMLEMPDFQFVNPNDAEVIIVSVTGPSGISVSEMYDLRRSLNELDNEVPRENMEGLSCESPSSSFQGGSYK